jgi:hypothetical protein
MTDAHERQARAVQRLVAIDGDESPLALLRRDLGREVKEQIAGVRNDVRDLSEKVAVGRAVAPVLELVTAKGFRFEDVLHARTSALAAQHGDVADRVGVEAGVSGSHKGDELVTLNREDTHGLEGAFVLEAKSRKLNMRSTVAELDDAMANRNAIAAVAVFTSQDQAPTAIPFHYTDNKAIVVLDKDGRDDSALRLAYMWARWVVRRQFADGDLEEVDLAKVGALIEDARRALERETTIKRFHSQAKRSIEQANEQMAALVAEVRQAIDSVAAEVKPS